MTSPRSPPGAARGEHVVDPATGRPPQGVLSVTVVGPDLATADACTTAAFALGADGRAWRPGCPAGSGACRILAPGGLVLTPAFDALRA
jgi:thiamine biosynthesis lipoprotein